MRRAAAPRATRSPWAALLALAVLVVGCTNETSELSRRLVGTLLEGSHAVVRLESRIPHLQGARREHLRAEVVGLSALLTELAEIEMEWSESEGSQRGDLDGDIERLLHEVSVSLARAEDLARPEPG